MAKHIFIPLIRNPNAALRIDVEHFARNMAKLQDNPRPLVHWPTAWFDAALIAHGHDGLIEVTPRGTDLLASIDSLPDDPTPEVKVASCSKCNGTGEQPLFVSMETCSRCKGGKTEPPHIAGVDFNALVDAFDGMLKPTYEIQVASGRTSSKHPNTDTFIYPTASGEVMERVSEHPWVLIDSEEVAQKFVGKRVQIDAPRSACYGRHEYHLRTETVTAAHGGHFQFYRGDCINWHSRGNVSLRIDGDPS